MASKMKMVILNHMKHKLIDRCNFHSSKNSGRIQTSQLMKMMLLKWYTTTHYESHTPALSLESTEL